MIAFIVMISLILGTIWTWVWLRLVETAAPPVGIYYPLLAVFLGSFFLQFARFVFRRSFEKRLWLQYVGYFFFGAMILLFMSALVKDPLLFALERGGLPVGIDTERAASLTVLALTLLGQLWGMRTAWAGPIVRKVRVPLPGWELSHLGLKVVQVSDLHVGASIKRPYVEKVVRQVLDLEPDLIAITGDLGDGNVFELGQDLEPLRQLKATHGVFYVTGNHEYYWDAKSWTAKLRELGFTVLENEGRWIEKAKLWVGGVPDISTHRGADGKPGSDPALAAPRVKVNGPRLLLAHQPKSVYGAAAAGFDLMLSGHTHSGQFFPANLVVRFFNPYHHGLARHGKLWVYVNAGTGFWGPPLRLFVPAEITLLRLEPETEADK